MKAVRQPPASRPAQSRELADLRARLAEAEDTLRAIRAGEVDAVVIAGRQGLQVFTLQGAAHAYRVLIESINEGALTLTADGVILYANQYFARMIKRPPERVIGSSFHDFLSPADQAALRPLLKRAIHSDGKIQLHLHTAEGSKMPALLSIGPLPRNGAKKATIGMVVTDMTAIRRAEEQLRSLMHRVVKAQEAERRRVARELHDHITQLLCAMLVRCQMLENALSTHDGPAQAEAMKLHEMLGQTAEEVERISRNLRPSVLDELGLVVVLRDTRAEFVKRTGVSVKLAFDQLPPRLPADTELAFYRILQEALTNVEQHARARAVTVRLRRQGALVQLVIHDDGIGFDPEHPPVGRKGKLGLGLLSMRERAVSAGGALAVKSAPGQGATIQAELPIRPGR